MNRSYITSICIGLVAGITVSESIRVHAQTSSFTITESLPKRLVSTDSSQSLALAGRTSPVVKPLVYVNGLLYCEGPDYSLNGDTVEFVNEVPPSSIVQIIYW